MWVQFPLLLLCQIRQIHYRKKEINILLISKEIAHKLNKLGVPWGYEGLSHSGTKSNKGRKYYLCEKPRNIKLLNSLIK